MNKNIDDLVRLAKYAGGRLDLVQALGGNAGVKHQDSKMLVTQAWDYTLSETESGQGYVSVDTDAIYNILNNPDVLEAQSLSQKNAVANVLVKQATVPCEIKPTAEVYLHAMLPFTFTLHLHPTLINSILVQDAAEKMLQVFIDDAGFVGYGTPGLEVSLIFKEYIELLKRKNKTIPHIIFMKNHGLMVGAESVDEIIQKVEAMLIIIEQHLEISHQCHRDATSIATLFDTLSKHHNIAYLSNDLTIKNALEHHQDRIFSQPTYPDQYIYNGLYPLELTELSTTAIQDYHLSHRSLPKVIIYRNNIYFLARNLKLAKQMEDVFRAHLNILQNVPHHSTHHTLKQNQIDEIRF